MPRIFHVSFTIHYSKLTTVVVNEERHSVHSQTVCKKVTGSDNQEEAVMAAKSMITGMDISRIELVGVREDTITVE
jgi:hypothetical protein